MYFEFICEFREYVEKEYEFDGKKQLSRRLRFLTDNDMAFSVSVPGELVDNVKKIQKGSMIKIGAEAYISYPWKKGEGQYPYVIDRSGNSMQLSLTLASCSNQIDK